MFGSQALETAIGLVLMFFVIALAASSIIEIYSRILKKRGKDLEAVITVMLQGDKPADPGQEPAKPGEAPSIADPNAPTDDERAARVAWERTKQEWDSWESKKRAHDAWTDAKAMFHTTSVFAVLQAAAKTRASTGFLGLRKLTYGAIKKIKKDWTPPTKYPSYMSAKSFADAVSEIIVVRKDLADLPPGLAKRLKPIVHEVGEDATKIKAAVERWFDDTMERMEGAYKRWATVGLFVTGLVLSVAANASTIDVAQRLWKDPATRQAVAEAASGVASSDRAAECPADTSGTSTTTTTVPTETTVPRVDCQIKSVAATVDALESLRLPIGWDKETRAKFDPWYAPWSWQATGPETASAVAGWILTALLVMLGAPFWFDLLTKLVSLRSSGSKPSTAADDPASNTTAAIRAESAPAIVAGRAVMQRSTPTTDANAALKSAFGVD